MRGLSAKLHHRQGEVILIIPQPALIRPIDAATSLGSDVFQKLDTALEASGMPDMSGGLALCLALERAVGLASRWAPYLASLPTLEAYRQFHPMLAHAEFLASLDGLPLAGKTLLEQELLRSAWSDAQTLMGERIAHLTFDDFMWGYLSVATHAVAGVMVPICDLANDGGEDGRNVHFLGWIGDCGHCTHVKATATRSINYGEELLYRYARQAKGLDNTSYMFMWGFCLKGNPHRPADLDGSLCLTLRSCLADLPDFQRPLADNLGILIDEHSGRTRKHIPIAALDDEAVP